MTPPRAAPAAGPEPAFHLDAPAGSDGAPPTPVVFASPHSGRCYPPDLLDASQLDAQAIRRSEDVLVDALIGGGADAGAAVLAARYARAFIDLNREPFELDPAMFEDALPAYASGHTARVQAGLGSIARVVGEGAEIYRRKLTFAEAAARIEQAHRPYHAELERLLRRAECAHGCAILIDWHSMPAGAAKRAPTRPDRPSRSGGADMVLGDRFGAACAPAVSRLIERELEAMGYQVVRNTPYAGGYVTEHYGRPARRRHALQVEINRALYLDEATLEPSDGFARLQADLTRLAQAVCGTDWRGLR